MLRTIEAGAKSGAGSGISYELSDFCSMLFAPLAKHRDLTFMPFCRFRAIMSLQLLVEIVA
jgi:hypothetical protein